MNLAKPEIDCSFAGPVEGRAELLSMVDGEATLEVMAMIPGVYSLSVSIDGFSSVKTSLTIVPGPSFPAASIVKLQTTSVGAGEPVGVTVMTNDRFSNQLYRGGDRISLSAQPCGTQGDVLDNDNGV